MQCESDSHLTYGIVRIYILFFLNYFKILCFLLLLCKYHTIYFVQCKNSTFYNDMTLFDRGSMQL